MKANSVFYKSRPFSQNIKQGVNLVAAFVRQGVKSRVFWCKVINCVFLLALVLIAFCGCGQKVVYKEVLVPQKCSVSQTPRPAKTGELEMDIDGLLIYTELLEQDLNVCLGKGSK